MHIIRANIHTPEVIESAKSIHVQQLGLKVKLILVWISIFSMKSLLGESVASTNFDSLIEEKNFILKKNPS